MTPHYPPIHQCEVCVHVIWYAGSAPPSWWVLHRVWNPVCISAVRCIFTAHLSRTFEIRTSGGKFPGHGKCQLKIKKTSVPQLLLHCAQRETGATRKQKLWSREQTKFSRTPPVGTLQMKATQTWRGLCPGNLAWFVSACATTCPNMPQQYKMYKWMFHRIPRKK